MSLSRETLQLSRENLHFSRDNLDEQASCSRPDSGLQQTSSPLNLDNEAESGSWQQSSRPDSGSWAAQDSSPCQMVSRWPQDSDGVEAKKLLRFSNSASTFPSLNHHGDQQKIMEEQEDEYRLDTRDSWMEAMATLTDSEDDDPVGISSLPTFKRKTGEDAIRRWSGVWEDGVGNFLPSTSCSPFWPEEGNDDSLQVIDCYPRPTEPESCEALDTLDKTEASQFLPNYLSGLPNLGDRRQSTPPRLQTGVRFWDEEELASGGVDHPPPPPAHSPRQQTDAESWYGDDEEDFGFETLAGHQQQPTVRRQKRKRWACAGSRTAAGGGGLRHPGYPGYDDDAAGDTTPPAGHQREALEGPRAVARGCEQAARSSEQSRIEAGGGLGGLRRSEEFVYSSNWESDSSPPDEEREE